MATADADVALDSFIEVEARFAAFLRAVPPRGHDRVNSPVLAALLLDGCSLIESILKSTMDNARYNQIQGIAGCRQRRYSQQPPFLNIGDLRTVFRPDSFYGKPVWFLANGKSSYPWYVWRNQAGQPKWWDAYNQVKHSRFQNARRATLGVTMHAMKALFLVLVQSLEFRARLVERGVIRCSGVGVAQLRPDASNWETLPTASQSPVVAVSALFGYKFLSQGNSARAADASVFL
jgi:hypothetical protein